MVRPKPDHFFWRYFGNDRRFYKCDLLEGGNGRPRETCGIARYNMIATAAAMSLSKLQPGVSRSQCPDVGPSPNQPRNISFPKVTFGKAKPVLRAFNASWFDKWGWLHWDESSARAFFFVKLMKIILVMPATNATSERSFSALKRVKTYLRSTMKQSRLNHLMILHVHKEMSDSLNLVDCANDFVGSNEHRLRVFGKFT